tara:strand:+ start:1176 stop:1415 length:240 start_codon:yes stop_codon:yes gene_type:complete
MVYGKLDPTILQSKTCKKMNDVIKSLANSLLKRKDTLTEDELETIKMAKQISKYYRNANAYVWGGAIAKRLRQNNNAKR